MDNAILLYFIKANLALAILYLCYKILFRKDTFFRLRRFTLMSIYLVAFLYQLPDISAWLSAHSGVTDVIVYYSSMLPKEIVSTADMQIQQTNWRDTAFLIVRLIYFAGAGLLLFRCLAELANVARTYLKCRKKRINGTEVCILPDAEEPYSFFGWIFVHPYRYSPKMLEEILLHERTHVRKKHSIDMIIGEIVTIVCWINPFAWLMKEEICLNHEFEADQEVMYAGYDKKGYQYHLIGLEHTDKAIAKLHNNFSVLPLKKRISMLNQKRTNSMSRIKYLALLPLMAGMLLINNIDVMARITTGQPEQAAAEVYLQATPSEATAPLQQDKDKKKSQCDVQPQFPGGEQAMFDFLAKNIKYPVIAQENGLAGRVTVSFIVNVDGTLTDIKIARGIDPSLDKEALRVVKAMPKWVPGKKDGKDVRSTFSIPVIFRLQ